MQEPLLTCRVILGGIDSGDGTAGRSREARAITRGGVFSAFDQWGGRMGLRIW
jgi:hypothetical protein